MQASCPIVSNTVFLCMLALGCLSDNNWYYVTYCQKLTSVACQLPETVQHHLPLTTQCVSITESAAKYLLRGRLSTHSRWQRILRISSVPHRFGRSKITTYWHNTCRFSPLHFRFFKRLLQSGIAKWLRTLKSECRVHIENIPGSVYTHLKVAHSFCLFSQGAVNCVIEKYICSSSPSAPPPTTNPSPVPATLKQNNTLLNIQPLLGRKKLKGETVDIHVRAITV